MATRAELAKRLGVSKRTIARKAPLVQIEKHVGPIAGGSGGIAGEYVADEFEEAFKSLPDKRRGSIIDRFPVDVRSSLIRMHRAQSSHAAMIRKIVLMKHRPPSLSTLRRWRESLVANSPPTLAVTFG
jgi:hypothetical protein